MIRRLTIAAAWLTASILISRDAGLAAQELPFVTVLGVAQDGGYPQAGCLRACCQRAWDDPTQARSVVCLAIVDPASKQRWLVECTPDFRQQLHALDELAPSLQGLEPAGILLTHAHIGHYTGLIHLGREAMGAKQVPVYAMPRMEEFLRTNGPWKLLLESKSIELRKLEADRALVLNERISVTPMAVPHRDEFSETVAFRIRGPSASILFLPDIDQWDLWDRSIEGELDQVDVAYLDATFFDDTELPGRNMREIQHPLVLESIRRFGALAPEQRKKIRFIHFNHTNPLLNPDSDASRRVRGAGLSVAEQGERVGL